MSGLTQHGLRLTIEHRVGSLLLSVNIALHAQRTALFGPSGAGKTTILRILAGLEQPDRGSASLGERQIVHDGRRAAPGASGVGLVTQQPALFPHLSIKENIAFGLHGMDIQQRSRLVGEHLERFGLDALQGRRPAFLSGGERQRVSLVRTLVRQPQMLLLDEPFSALDGERKAETWAALDAYLNQHRIHALLVTHDAAEVWGWADEMLRIENGRIIGQGPPAELLQTERARVLQLFNARGAELP